MSYFATPSLLFTKNGDFSGRKYCKYWGSTVGCTEKTCSIKRTNIYYILKVGLLSSGVHSV